MLKRYNKVARTEVLANGSGWIEYNEYGQFLYHYEDGVETVYEYDGEGRLSRLEYYNSVTEEHFIDVNCYDIKGRLAYLRTDDREYYFNDVPDALRGINVGGVKTKD